MESLAQLGERQIGVRELCARLGVTTGSFYAHFHGREDFARSVAQHWRQRYTTSLIEELRGGESDPTSRLRAVAEGVIQQGLGKYDVAIRAWAAHEPAAARIVRRVDDERLEFVRDGFRALGLRGADLDMRARTFMTYFSFEHAQRGGRSKRERLAEIPWRIEMLTQPRRG